MFTIFKKKKEFSEYGYAIYSVNLPGLEAVEYAQWQHPGELGRVFSREDLEFFQKYIKPGDFVIDIGAQQGDTTVPMALAAGKSGLTLALEPNPHAFKILQKNAELNPTLTNITPLNFAATKEDGTFTFGSGDASFGNGGIVGFTHNKKRNVRYTFDVVGKNLSRFLLDSYENLLPKLSFIKIDTEGYDKEVIKSLDPILQRSRPVIVTEVFGPSLIQEKQELLSLLRGKRYELFKIPEFRISLIEKMPENTIDPKKTFNILAIPHG
jgi:FkbM family methyltransferase